MNLLRTPLAAALTVALLPAPVWARVGPPPADAPAADSAVEGPSDDAPAAGDDASDSAAKEPVQEDPLQNKLIERAAKHFMDGVQLFNGGDYVGAAAEFERSYAAARTGSALRNVALSYSKADMPIPGIRAARRYLALPVCDSEGAGPLHCAKSKEDVERILDRMLRNVGELRLVVESGVEIRKIRVAGRVVPQEDFPIVLEPGPVEVLVSGAGPDEELSRTVRMWAGEQTSLRVPSFEEPEVETEPSPKKPPEGDTGDRERFERRQRALKTSFWAGLGITIAAGASVGILGAFTLRAKDNFETAQDDIADMMGPPEDTAQRFYRLRNTTNAMVAVTAVVGMATLVVGLFAFSPNRSDRRRASTHKRYRITPGGVAMRF